MSVETKITNNKMNTEITNTEFIPTASADEIKITKKKVVKTKVVEEFKVANAVAKIEANIDARVEERVEEVVFTPVPPTKLSDDELLQQELEEADRALQVAMERRNAIQLKRTLVEKSGEIMNKVRDNLIVDIKSNKDAIAKLREETKAFEAELARLEAINPETDDVVGFLQENYKDIVEGVKTGEKKKVAPAKASAGSGRTGVRINRDRDATRDAIPDRMVLRASAPHQLQKSNIVWLDIIYRASTKTFYRYGGSGEKTEYKTLQDANREWCNKREHTKMDNAWWVFKAFDRQGVMPSLHINELQDPAGNWTTDMKADALDRYRDIHYKF